MSIANETPDGARARKRQEELREEVWNLVDLYDVERRIYEERVRRVSDWHVLDAAVKVVLELRGTLQARDLQT
jgi:hypothetical protein